MTVVSRQMGFKEASCSPPHPGWAQQPNFPKLKEGDNTFLGKACGLERVPELR